jgi:ABC-type multidrug transport system fused ATPase/permease subunit
VTLVLQESLLFRNTVWNNIAYGRPSATKDDIMAAAEAAGVVTFVDDLEDGWETIVSERGSTLSGGQKQCIALARALLRAASIVIMDEPTSSMDAATEQLVMRGIGRLIQGRTAIIIAHRISTIRGADMVAVMDEGRLVQWGLPSEVVNEKGLLATMAQVQESETVDSQVSRQA